MTAKALTEMVSVCAANILSAVQRVRSEIIFVIQLFVAEYSPLLQPQALKEKPRRIFEWFRKRVGFQQSRTRLIFFHGVKV